MRDSVEIGLGRSARRGYHLSEIGIVPSRRTRDIDLVSLCEHHGLPFDGHAWVGYLRNSKIIGISKLTRIVRVYTRRFSVQERIAQEIVNALINLTDPFGAAVYLEAKHSCTRARGVYEVNAKTRTFLARGAYSQHSRLIDEFMVVAGLHRPITP